MNELQIIDTNGEIMGVDQVITKLKDKKYLKTLETSQIESLAYVVQSLKQPIKNIDDEVKNRLANGTEFEHISESEGKRTNINDDEKVAMAFLKKYGIGALQVRTPTQLRKKFGEDIDKDIAKPNVTVTKKFRKIKFD